MRIPVRTREFEGPDGATTSETCVYVRCSLLLNPTCPAVLRDKLEGTCRERARMRHASAETLEEIEPLLHELRSVPGLVEKSPGVFYRKSKAFLHFHEDPTGLHARRAVRRRVQHVRTETGGERRELMARIRAL